MRPMTYAVITTYNRPKEALQCIKTLGETVDTVLVVDNGADEPFPDYPNHFEEASTLNRWYVIRDSTQPVNLSALWNLGLDWCQEDALRMEVVQWDVAILNDDLLVPPGWVIAVQTGMRIRGATAGCSHWGFPDYILQQPGPVNLHQRMTGWAFMLNGEHGLRADENLHWWYGDDDLDWQAREKGGMLSINFAEPMNLHPNGLMTPERQVQAGKDRYYFEHKWGVTPW